VSATDLAERNIAPALHMKRRHFLLAILAAASSARAASGEARRFRVAFANLNETPGTSIEGLGFSGAEIRRSFELASRSLPLDMIYYDNGGDAAKALANAADAVSRKVDLLIEYNSDAEANAEIGRQLKAADIPVLALNHPIPDAPLYTADHLAAGRIAGQTLGQFAKENWSDQTPVAAILGDVADPSPSVAARIQGVTEGLRQDLPTVPPVLLDSAGHSVRAEGVLARFLGTQVRRKLLIATLDDASA
jgi:ribose transport system substrate-binding protein